MSVKSCLFPVAGYGTRFLPATKSMPKEMLPIVDRPVIQYVIEEAIARVPVADFLARYETLIPKSKRRK